MSEKKWSFFPFEATDYKAAQAWLDKKAEQGWVLDHIYLRRIARFVPAEGRYHCVELDLNTEWHTETGDDYLQLCEDAGWELVKNNPGLFIFRSKPGQHPVPIQSDETLEAERFWKKLVRKNFLISLTAVLFYAALLVLGFFLGERVFAFSRYLCKNSSILLPFLLLFLTAEVLRELIRAIRAYIAFRRHGTLPQQNRLTAWVFGIFTIVACALLIVWWGWDLAEDLGLNETVNVEWSLYSKEETATLELCQSYPVITAADLGLESSNSSRYLDGRRSIFVNMLNFDDAAYGQDEEFHRLYTDYYKCANDTLAGWLFRSRRTETAHGVDFLWGDLEWGETTSAYGFDHICFACNNAYLLAQDGNTVILVGATGIDLTEHLDTIRQRVGLEE